MLSSNIQVDEFYRYLYRKLKSQEVLHYIDSRFDRKTREKLIKEIRNLPHPEVASKYDIYYVSKLCTSGVLEELNQLIGNDANILLESVGRQYPEVKLIEGTVPALPPHPESKEIVDMLSWTNTTLGMLYSISTRTLQRVDIIMKGQCPFCHNDLVTYILGSELRLRCKDPSKSKDPRCRTNAWIIGSVTTTSP